MSRSLRIDLAGGVYHVTARGDRREAIYFGDADRRAWLDLLGAVCERYNWRCHAYCQMTNHYHVVVETPEGNLSQGMRQLSGVYTQHINHACRRVGHLFQGRYKGILVKRKRICSNWRVTWCSIRSERGWWAMPATGRGAATVL